MTPENLKLRNEFLTEEARQEWDEIVPELERHPEKESDGLFHLFAEFTRIGIEDEIRYCEQHPDDEKAQKHRDAVIKVVTDFLDFFEEAFGPISDEEGDYGFGGDWWKESQ